MTTIYFIRHSKPMKHTYLKNSDSLQLQNEKKILTVDGEKLAQEVSMNSEFDDIDKVYSSNYIRTISTAKYIADKNNLDMVIDEDLGERKIGITSWDEYPENFEIKQFNDFDYKLPKGESLSEVRDRLYESLINIINTNRDKRIVIVCHSTAMMALFSKWCEVSYDSEYKFNGKTFFNGKWNYCEIFKLEFSDNNNLVSIESIKSK